MPIILNSIRSNKIPTHTHTHTPLLVSFALVVTGPAHQSWSPYALTRLLPSGAVVPFWCRKIRWLVVSRWHVFAVWFQWRAVNRGETWLALEQRRKVDCWCSIWGVFVVFFPPQRHIKLSTLIHNEILWIGYCNLKKKELVPFKKWNYGNEASHSIYFLSSVREIFEIMLWELRVILKTVLFFFLRF